MNPSTLSSIRKFNRFITVQLKVFDRYALGTKYSLVEGRIIGEIGRHQGCSANEISAVLKMDKSYLSRILKSMISQGLVKRYQSELDKRVKVLELTAEGNELYDTLEMLSNQQVGSMIDHLNRQETKQLLECMTKVQRLMTTGKETVI